MKKLGIEYVRGYPVMGKYGVVVIPTFDPKFIRTHTKLMPVLADDYRKAFNIARDGLNVLPVESIVRPNPAQVRDLRDRVLAMDPKDPNLWLIFDFETDNTMPNMPRNWTPPLQSVQFSLGPQHAVFMDWNAETAHVIREILGSPVRKAGHNVYDFDLLVAHNNQIPVGGVVDDSLFMFHHYQPDLTVEDSGTEADKDFRYSTAAGLQYVASFYGADSAQVTDPAGCQRPGWKHLRLSESQAERDLYGNLDVAMNARIIYGCKGFESLPSQLRKQGLWEGYERYVRQFYPVLQRAADRGIPIDRPGQFGMDRELAKVEIDIDRKIQAAHPNQLKRRDPALGYVRPPKESAKIKIVDGVYYWLDEGEDVTVDEQKDMAEEASGDVVVTGVWRPMVQEVFNAKIKKRFECACLHTPSEENCIKANAPADHAGCLSVTKQGLKIKKGIKALNGRRPLVTCRVCRNKGMYTDTVVENVTRWVKVLPFRPSNKQFAAYISFRRHKLPTDRKTKKVTTNAKKIQELNKKHPDALYQGVLDIRTVEKVRSTYVTGRGWVARNDSGAIIPMEQQEPRIHTTFTLGPATGQTSSRRPNIQNVPKHIRNENLRPLELPKRFRRLIAARPGHRIWEFDLKSAHALTLGLEARDADYMKLARIDVHSWFTSVLAWKRGLWPAPVNTNQSIPDLTAALKEIRAYVVPSGPHKGLRFEADIRDVSAKPAILGIGFGMQGYKLWETNKESFANEYDAQDTINLFFEHRPLLKKYQDDVLAEAHANKCLVSRGGFIRRFWHVWDFVYDPRVEGKYTVKHGEDAEDAKAFRPANTAFVYIRDALCRLDAMGVLDEGGFCNQVHDSVVFEMPDAVADRLAPIIKQELERPQPLLGDPEFCPEGLWIECDAAAGPNWGDMKKVKVA
jgi:hypothetical protein